MGGGWGEASDDKIMKKYIYPAVKQVSLDSEDIMDLIVSNTQGDEGQFANDGLFDDLDDNLDDDIRVNEMEARRKNYSSFHVWER